MAVQPMLPAVGVRAMTLDDLDEAMVIQREAFAHPWSADLMRRELGHDWSRTLLAVEASTPSGALREPPAGRDGLHARAPGERILGFVIFWLVHDEVHILNVATAPRERRRGVGRLLMLEAEAIGRRHGAVLSTLEVRRSNEPAIALYRGMGYRPAGVRPGYYADENEDAIVMVKQFDQG